MVEKMNHRPIILLVRRPFLTIVVVIAVLLILGGSVRIVKTMALSIKNKVIVIDAGHGGQDPGAIYGDVKEKEINLDIALRLSQTLSSKGCKVILTRDKDEDFFLPGFVKGRLAKRAELNQRINMAKSNNADLFVSIHANSFPQRSTYGMETFYHIKSAPGKALAERIQSQLKNLQKDNKRIAKAGDYYLINQTKMPSVIIEVGYISNSRERNMLGKDSYKDSIANAIASGIENYFNDFPFGLQDSQPALAWGVPAPAGSDAYRLYYPNETLDDLTYEERTSLSWRNLTVSEQVKLVIDDLLKGPHNSKSVNVFPSSTQIRDINVVNGIVTLDFNRDIRDKFSGGAAEEDLGVRSLVWNVCQIPKINGLRILIEGQFSDSIAGHILLNHTMTPQPVNGEIALVIDDFGINNPGTQQMLELGVPITAAIMPNLLYSQQEAELLHNRGYEIIVHIPVEAKNGRSEWLGPGALTTDLSPQELKARINQSLEQISYAVGISNHMGSKGTENPKVVEALVETAKEHKILILDSKTSDSTILAREAIKAGVISGTRDVFLDNSADLNSIKKQLRLLITKAKTSGKAIGIGHVGPQGPNTARAIREMLPEMKAQGIQIVPLSEILQQ
ncbi:MAG: divergent polysaccharide deacetylase family protein [Desulfitobacteriaceae bacterium]